MERPPNLVLDQGLEPADPAGLPWVRLVLILLEPYELQHELLMSGDAISACKLPFALWRDQEATWDLVIE
jgi:hypothetical protein